MTDAYTVRQVPYVIRDVQYIITTFALTRRILMMIRLELGFRREVTIDRRVALNASMLDEILLHY